MRTGTFITNDKEKSLKTRLKTLIEKSEEMKFLIGFFYFSGIKEFYNLLKKLYENRRLGDNHIKILIGLNVDEGAFGLYEYAKLTKYFDNQIKEEFFDSIKKAFNSEALDTEEVYEQVFFFVKLLEEGKLVLRKTLKPSHAKLYIFKMNNELKDVLPGVFITGSSNLTKAGIEEQNEFNVEIKDYGLKEAEEYFDNLWENSIELTEKDIAKIKDIIKNKSFLLKISPFLAYTYLLKLYIEIQKGKTPEKELIELLKEKGYYPYTYQLEAVAQAIANCNTHGGTILADVVGLGKTVIACLVAKSLGKRGIVICPPHLIGDENKTSGWKKYLEDFKLWDWEVKSIGKLKETLSFIKEHDEFKIVIVDEAHRFRNEKTQNYHYLHEICRGKTVILLSATPFNNRPKDLFSLLKLFTVPKKSTIMLDEDLETRFLLYETEFKKLAYIKSYYNSAEKDKRKRAQKYYRDIFGNSNFDIKRVRKRTKELAKKVRAILEPVVIRRNRLDLKYYKEKIELSEVKDPQEWFFELTKEQLSFYDTVIKSFAQVSEGGLFKGAIYIPIKYEKGISELLDLSEDLKLNEEESFLYTYQKNLYDFMRRLLVKRFESSFGAFRESIIRFRDIHKTALKFIEKTKRFVLNRKLMEDISEKDPEDILEELKEYEEEIRQEKVDKKYYKIYEIDKFKERQKFISDIESDLRLFEELLTQIDSLSLYNFDPKAERLISGIRKFLEQNRKVVIFTEYLDTAKYLKEILEEEFKEIVLSAFGNLSKITIEALYKNFDAQYPEQEDRYKILLATDKLSEGFNLNRAGAVINYDIPWNPVRVIQRVGRINRIGKKIYDEIYIINFFPTEKGADIVKSKQIAQTKMFMIHNVLGEDAKIFDPDEEPQASELYKRLNTYPEEEEESFFTKIKKEYEDIKRKFPDIEKNIRELPRRIKLAKKGEKNELMVFVKKGKDLFVGYKDYNEKQPIAISFEEVYEKIKAEENEPNLELSQDFWRNYHQVLNKDNYIRRPKVSKTLIKANNLLNTFLELKEKDIEPYKEFISDILEDIKHYGTLSEYTISKIIELENDIKTPQRLASSLKALKDEIGEDFLKKAIEHTQSIKEEIIIAIENQEETNA